jgi:7-cyano-7-deazaguanosine (preQ0) biosynthesis protein QueE
MLPPYTARVLVVSEVFGPTVQGEGPSLGHLAGFVRLGRCNLQCSWCDTPFTWDWSKHDPAVELSHREVDEVARDIEVMHVPLVVITGGEPLLQQSHLPPLLERLRSTGHRIEVETAGTLAPSPQLIALVDRFNVSPKLANSGNPLERRYKPDALRAFATTGSSVFKFVVRDESELDEVAAIVDECALPDASIWIMPEGTDAETLLGRSRTLAEPVIGRGWNLTSRLHILLWSDERGR